MKHACVPRGSSATGVVHASVSPEQRRLGVPVYTPTALVLLLLLLLLLLMHALGARLQARLLRELQWSELSPISFHPCLPTVVF